MKSPIKFPLRYQEILQEVYYFAKARKVRLYLVGGILRDLILGRVKENPDFDFALKSGAISFGRKLAYKLKAGFVVLDVEHGACRIVKKLKTRTCTFDLTDFRGPTIKDDLLHRDFSINSLGLSFEDIFVHQDSRQGLIDLYGGTKDINKGIIRMVNIDSFRDDPLRILRAFSFSATLGFAIDKNTLASAKSNKLRLAGVSGERVRDELFKIFDSDKSFEYLANLDRLKIMDIIFPEIKKMRGIGQGPYHHLDVWQHTLETVKQLEGVFLQLERRRDIREYLDKIISAGRKRRQLLKLGAFLHDFGKPQSLRRKGGKLIFHGHENLGARMAEDIGRRLRLSNDEINALKIIIKCHLRPGYLADGRTPSARAIFRYFRDSSPESVSTLLISIADQRATKGPLTTRVSRLQHEKVCATLIRRYFFKQKEKPAPRLLNGDDLIKKFRLSPSPLIGKLLSEIEELQAIGSIKTKKQALDAARKIIKQP